MGIIISSARAREHIAYSVGFVRDDAPARFVCVCLQHFAKAALANARARSLAISPICTPFRSRAPDSTPLRPQPTTTHTHITSREHNNYQSYLQRQHRHECARVFAVRVWYKRGIAPARPAGPFDTHRTAHFHPRSVHRVRDAVFINLGFPIIRAVKFHARTAHVRATRNTTLCSQQNECECCIFCCCCCSRCSRLTVSPSARCFACNIVITGIIINMRFVIRGRVAAYICRAKHSAVDICVCVCGYVRARICVRKHIKSKRHARKAEMVGFMWRRFFCVCAYTRPAKIMIKQSVLSRAPAANVLHAHKTNALCHTNGKRGVFFCFFFFH